MSFERDKKLIDLLSKTLEKLSDFKDNAEAAATLAREVVSEVRKLVIGDEEEFRDQLLSIVANVGNLEGELGEGGLTGKDLAKMDISEMLSRKQKIEREKFSRKRAREQINKNNLSLLCSKCGRTRMDRININEFGLDSEENGSHFEYHFDSMCSCDHSSEEEESEEDEEKSDSKKQASENSTPPEE